jgi:hypothetical protein
VDAFGGVGQNVRLAVDGGHGRVRGGELPDEGGEAQLTGVVQVLAAEDQGLVLQERYEESDVCDESGSAYRPAVETE